jgi:hypothetical protein
LAKCRAILPSSVKQTNMSTFSLGSNAIEQPVVARISMFSALRPCFLISSLTLVEA